MEPTLAAGDRLLVRRTQRPRRGDVVALRDPRDGHRVLVKRVAALNDDGVVVLLTDTPAAEQIENVRKAAAACPALAIDIKE